MAQQTRHQRPTATAPKAAPPSLFETLEPLPPEIEEEAAPTRTAMVPVRGPLQPQGGPTDVAQLAFVAPDKIKTYLSAISEAHALLREFAIRATAPSDWVLFRDREGTTVAILASSGALKVRKLLGISIFNYRPTSGGIAEPSIREETLVTEDRDGKPTGKTITIAIGEMFADGRCARTGEEVTDVYFALRSKDQQGKSNFTGRGHEQDLKAAVRTGVDTKVVRILAGLSKVDAETLAANGIKVEACRKGAGFGTAQDRDARRVSETGGDLDARRKRLHDEILRRVSGDTAAARDLLKDITKWSKDGEERWMKSVDQLTQAFQIEKAEGALAKHPRFGGPLAPLGKTDAPPSERQPGEDG